ncbi:hypothetical protein MJO28_002555 [Puccinia striiformis f. sp. tritici]|uniref:Uncharacterized protein n=1 Tax=Puccinia striiformis f. sp. tritici TaxID=168172 RepID=A0ACC0ER02_9BASI|nr:hypothetical protein MJO28_002555 [Puccinia striiformis f. sp. tritici]
MEQATEHLGSPQSSPHAAEDRSVLTGGPSHLDQATTNPPALGGQEEDAVTAEHAYSAVSSREKEDAHAYIGRLSRLEPVTTKPHSIMASEKAMISPKYFMVVSKRLFKMDEKQRAGLEDWLQEKAGIEVWEGQPMEISELVDHTLDFLNQQNKVSLEYFTFAFRRLFKMDQKQRATLETWLQGQAGLKLLQGQHTESSVLADHTLKFLNQNKNTFSEWLGGEYEEMRKQSLAKEFDPVTLEESIEFYYPSIHEDQRQSVLRFALGLRVVEKEKPSLDHQWTLEDLKKLFKHWDDIAGPKKMTPWVTMSLKDFNEVTHKVLGFEPDVQDAKDNYFKSLLSWDLREEHQKFSLEELIHYTTLVMREEKILSGLWVWRNEIYFIDVQNMLMEQYLWHMIQETLEPTIDLLGVNLFEAEKASFTQFAKRKLLSNKENFPLENLGAGKLAKLFHEWKSGVKEHGEISLESKVLSRTTNGIQDGPGKESAPVPESLPGTWLEDSVEGKMRLSHEKEGAHAYLGRLSHLEPVNTQPPSSTASQEATVSLKYFCVASKRLFKMDEKQTVSLENWLQRDAGIFDLPQGRHNKISELVDSTFDFLKQNNKYLFFELLGIDSDSEWKKKESLARGFDPVTLEESIEFYYPSINKVQRQAVLRFAEGLRAVNEKEPSLDYRWTLKDLKKLFKHWDDIAGPGKNTPQVMMSLKEFNKHAPTIFTYDPVNQDDINNYLKSLLSWDIGDEHQKFSLEELIHYTTLAIKEREISVPDYVQLHSEVDFFFSSQDWRKKGYLWKILCDTLVDFFKVKFLDDKQLSFARFVRQNFLSEDGNFPKENLGVDKIESLLEEFTEKTGISLDSEVLPEDPNMTQHGLVAGPSPEKLLEHSDGGEMQTSSDISSGEANAPLKPQWERNKELLEQLFRSHPTLSQEDKDSFQQFAREKHVVEIDSGETLDFNRLQGWYKEWNGTQRRRPFMASLKNWWHRVLQFWQKILGLGKK